jgi:hypothetical protein
MNSPVSLEFCGCARSPKRSESSGHLLSDPRLGCKLSSRRIDRRDQRHLKRLEFQLIYTRPDSIVSLFRKLRVPFCGLIRSRLTTCPPPSLSPASLHDLLPRKLAKRFSPALLFLEGDPPSPMRTGTPNEPRAFTRSLSDAY